MFVVKPLRHARCSVNAAAKIGYPHVALSVKPKCTARGNYTKASKATSIYKDHSASSLRYLFAGAGIASSLLLWNASGGIVAVAHAESPVLKKGSTKDLQVISTLPLQQVPPVQYDTSEENLRDACAELAKLLGKENVNVVMGDRVSHSSTEWSPAPNPDVDIPSMVVYPKTTEEVSEIAKICHRRRIPMIGFSGGTSLESSLAASHKEVCIDFSRHMNKIVKFRKDDMDVTVEPSVGYQELNEFLAADGAFFPPDPGPGAQIGGMVATGCSGTNAYRYGTMKDWVLGLEVVLADGTIIKTRGRPRKSSTGYDLTRLFVGSAGTLGLVTKIHLKLTNAPKNVKVAVAQFPTVHDAVGMAVKVVQSGHQLECMELLDEVTMRGVNAGGYCSREWDEKPSIFMKISGHTPADVEKTAKAAEKMAKNNKCYFFSLAKDDEEGDELWEARKTAMWSCMSLKRNPDDQFLSADACVPISRLGDIISASQEKLRKSGMLGYFLGHVGDGNFHTIVLYNSDEEKKARKMISDIQRMSVDMDGTISGEHGIGLEFRDQMPYELGTDTVDAMRRLKFALDPLGLLNPGKVVRIEKP